MPGNTGNYNDIVPNEGSQQRLPFQSRQSGDRTPKSKSWKAPATIILALFVGLGFALAHHFMGSYLDNKPVSSISVSQAWISRFGTAMAFAVKIAFATSVAAAYTQHQWLRLQQQSFRTEEVDALTSVLSNALSFMSSTVWARHPMLAVVALVSWAIPLAAIVAPGSLTVAPIRQNETMSLQVPQPTFNMTNFATIQSFTDKSLSSEGRIFRLAYQVASSGRSVALASTHQNETYHLDFSGPAVRCASANDSVVYNLTDAFGITRMFRGEATRFASWTPGEQPGLWGSVRNISQALDYVSTDAARIFVMSNTGTWDKTDMHPDESYPPRQVNVTECLLYNATYSVDFDFKFPDQSKTVQISNWLNPVATYRDSSDLSDNFPNATEAAVISYSAVMDAFGRLLVGYSSTSRYGMDRATRTSWKMMNIDWSDGQAVIHDLEQMFQNITLSLLSDDGLVKNSTVADLIPVEVTTFPVTYIYTRADLLLAYGIAFLCASCCAIIGLRAFLDNDASYQNLFSTYLRATNTATLRSRIDPGDTGSDPLPKALAQTAITLGQQADSNQVDVTRLKESDVELHLLHREDFGVPLEVSDPRGSEDALDRVTSPPESTIAPDADDDAQVSDRSSPSLLEPDVAVGQLAIHVHRPAALQAARGEETR